PGEPLRIRGGAGALLERSPVGVGRGAPVGEAGVVVREGDLQRYGGQALDVLVFDLEESLAHVSRPDATATHATYPFITRTALRGLLGAILGLEEFLYDEARAGVRLMSPVQKSVQELSMLGKGFLGNGPEFNRPTSIELLVQPH